MDIINEEIEKLWDEISSKHDLKERIMIIHSDIVNDKNKFKPLAEEDPYRLFKLLGGDALDATRSNWAFEYTYENYIEDYDIEFDSKEAESWDIEERSIERAHDIGYWYVTGIVSLDVDESSSLLFEVEFAEGYFDGIIGTPYDQGIGSKCYGIEFD